MASKLLEAAASESVSSTKNPCAVKWRANMRRTFWSSSTRRTFRPTKGALIVVIRSGNYTVEPEGYKEEDAGTALPASSKRRTLAVSSEGSNGLARKHACSPARYLSGTRPSVYPEMNRTLV